MGWEPHPHGAIEKHADNLWSVEGTLPPSPLPRRMVVVRLEDGRLVIHSGVALNDEGMAQLEAWGRPAVLVVPNRFHRHDAAAFKERYPELRVLCPPSAQSAVAQVVGVDGTVDELNGEATLDVFTLPSCKAGEVALIVRHADDSATAVLNDAVFNLPHQPGFGGFVMKLIGSTGGPRVTNIGKMLLVDDRAGFAVGLRELAAVSGLNRILPAHGEVIEGDAAATLRGIADRLHS